MPQNPESISEIRISPLNKEEKVYISQIIYFVESLQAEFPNVGSGEHDYLEERISLLKDEIEQIIGSHIAAAYAMGPIRKVQAFANGIVASAVAAARSNSRSRRMEVVFGTGRDSLRQVISAIVNNSPPRGEYTYAGYVEKAKISEEDLYQKYFSELGYPTNPQNYLNSKDKQYIQKQVDIELSNATQIAAYRDSCREYFVALEERRTIRWENQKWTGFLGLSTEYKSGTYVWDGTEFGKKYLWNFLIEQCLEGSALTINNSLRYITPDNIEEIYFEIIG
jgi:hypothetical protein